MITALTSVLSTVLPSLAPTISALIAKIPEKYLPEIVAKIAEILIEIGKEILLCKDSMDELGYKAINAEKKPEDFSNKTDYLKYLNDSCQFNKADFNSLPENKKLELKIAGTFIYSAALNEHLGIVISPATLLAFSAMSLEPKNVIDVCDKLISIGQESTNIIDNALKGTGSEAEIERGLNILKDVLFSQDTDADKKLDDMIRSYDDKIKD